MNKTNPIFLSIVVSTLILTPSMTGCENKASKGNVLVTYDGGAVTEADFMKAVNSLPNSVRTVAESKKAEFLDSFVTERILLQEAEAKGVQHLAEVQDLVMQARNRILVTKLLSQEIDSKLDVSDADVKAYYDSHPDEFIVPYRVRASHILIRDRVEAEAVLAKIKAGELFEELAKKVSMDPTASKGGDLGYITKGQLIPEIEEVIFGLKKGDVSAVVQSKFGYHILKATGEAKPQTKELRLVAKDIRDRLMLEKKSQSFTDLVDRLKKKAQIKTNADALDKLSLAPPLPPKPEA